MSIQFGVRWLCIFLTLALSVTACGAETSSQTAFSAPNQVVRDCTECPSLVKLPKIPSSAQQLMMARHELTWAEYIPSVLASGCPLPALAQGSNYPSDLMKMADDYPIGWLAPDDFDCYLGWLSKKTGHIYRLPTGAEWEFAARAGATTRFAWGHDPGFNNAAINTWFDPRAISKKATFAFDPREQTGKGRSYFPVESFPPNAWGLYDVIGNVSEYTAETKPGDAVCIHNAGAEKCTVRAVRGGSTSSIGLRLERDGSTHLVGEDINPFEDVAWYMGGFANLPGFRIV